MKKEYIICLFSILLSTAAYGGQISRIELTDGSIINGEIVSYANGIYVINAVNFGEVKVDAAKISKIESANYSPSNISIPPSVIQPGNLTPSGIDAYRQKLMSDPGNAAIITGLAADPRIQEMIQDPQIQDAAKTGNIQALMKSEKFMHIVNDPKTQETMNKLKQ